MTGARLYQDNFPVGRTPPVGDGFYFRMSAEGVPGLQEALRRAGHPSVTGTAYPAAGNSVLIRFESAAHFATAQQTMDRLKAAGAHAAVGYELLSPQAISHAAAFMKVPPEVLPMRPPVETTGHPTHVRGPNSVTGPLAETPERYARVQGPEDAARARALLQRAGDLPAHVTPPLPTATAPRTGILHNLGRILKRTP